MADATLGELVVRSLADFAPRATVRRLLRAIAAFGKYLGRPPTIDDLRAELIDGLAARLFAAGRSLRYVRQVQTSLVAMRSPDQLKRRRRRRSRRSSGKHSTPPAASASVPAEIARFDVAELQVVGTNGESLCCACSESPPAVDGLWCSRRCRMIGNRMIAESPTPAEIRERMAAIRATWPDAELVRRSQVDLHGPGHKPGISNRWIVPTVCTPAIEDGSAPLW